MIDAVNSLAGGFRREQVAADDAAQQIASADLPTATTPDPTSPVAPKPPAQPGVDLAGQLVAMTVAVDMQHVTTAALRSAFGMYRDSLDLLRPEQHRDT